MTQDYVVAAFIAALVVVAGTLMVMSWRRRAHAQSGLFDTVPQKPANEEQPTLGPLTGVYMGSTRAGRWQDRITKAPLGFRNGGTLTAFPSGLLLQIADQQVWVAQENLVSVRQESKLANKVVPGGGLLIVRWHIYGTDGATEIDSGFRADDKDTYPQWVAVRGTAAELTTADHGVNEEK